MSRAGRVSCSSWVLLEAALTEPGSLRCRSLNSTLRRANSTAKQEFGNKDRGGCVALPLAQQRNQGGSQITTQAVARMLKDPKVFVVRGHGSVAQSVFREKIGGDCTATCKNPA